MGFLGWLSKKTAKSTPLDAAAPEAPPPAEQSAEEPIEDLVAALDSSNGGLRADASLELLERWRAGDKEAAEVLAGRLDDLLEDAEPIVRLNGLSGVRLLRNPDNLARHASAAMARLNDPVAQVRTAAVGTVARIPGEAARAQVRAVLQSSEEPMRFQAACVLADLHDSAALPELEAALEQGIRRQEALSALMSLGDSAALPAVGAVFEQEGGSEFDRTMAAAALARLGDVRGNEHLAERVAAGGDDCPVAAEMAGRLFVQEAVPALRELSEQEGAPARGAALRALGRLRAPGAEERLLAIASDAGAAEDLRMDAAEGLAEFDGAGARAQLEALAQNAGGELGPLCIELLSELAQQDALRASAAQADAVRDPAAQPPPAPPAATKPLDDQLLL